MIQRRTLLKSTAAAVALGAPSLSGLAQQAVTLKFHTFMAPQSNVWLTMHKPWMEKVEKESGGRIKFEGYPAMQLGGTPVQLYDQAKDGVVDIVWTLPGNTAGRFPRIEVFELPFMMNNAEATSKAYWEYVQTVAPDEFKDVQVLALHVHGPGMFHTKDKLIKTVDDLKGMKVRGPTRQITKMLGLYRRHAGGHAAARHSRCAVQGHHRWLRDSLGGRALGQGPRTHQVPQRVRQLRRRALHHHLRDGNEQGQVQLARARPEEGHRQQLGHGDLRRGWAKSSRATTRTGARRPKTARTRSTRSPPADAQEFKRKARLVEVEWVQDMDKRGFDGKKLLETARTLIDKHGKAEAPAKKA